MSHVQYQGGVSIHPVPVRECLINETGIKTVTRARAVNVAATAEFMLAERLALHATKPVVMGISIIGAVMGKGGAGHRYWIRSSQVVSLPVQGQGSGKCCRPSQADTITRTPVTKPSQLRGVAFIFIRVL